MSSHEIIQTLILGGGLAVVGYLAKDKLESIENDIRKNRGERIDEHKVVIKWLGNITDALREEDFDVKRPPEVKDTLDVHEGDD